MNQKIIKPIFIAGCPRSGTTLLFSLLSSFSELWSPYMEIHSIYEWDIGLHPDLDLGESNLLTDEHVNKERKIFITNALWKYSANSEYFGISHLGNNYKSKIALLTSKIIKYFIRNIRIVDKNPKHCFRILFLKELYPDAKFIFIFREGKSNVASLLEGWESGRFKTYKIPHGSNENYFQWSFELPPGWNEFLDKSIPEICAFQYDRCNRYLLNYSDVLNQDSFIKIYYEDLISKPNNVMSEISEFINVDRNYNKIDKLPILNTISLPSKDKWRKREKEIMNVMDIIEPIMSELGYK